MGRRGPKPDPTALKEARGNPGKRPLNQNEPRPPKGEKAPAAPKWLHRAAATKWRALAPILHRLGLLTEVDHEAFARLCINLALYEEHHATCQKTGEWQSTEKGVEILRPAAILRRQALEDARKELDRFGMSPSARSSIRVGKPGQDDPLLDYIDG